MYHTNALKHDRAKEPELGCVLEQYWYLFQNLSVENISERSNALNYNKARETECGRVQKCLCALEQTQSANMGLESLVKVFDVLELKVIAESESGT